MMEAFNTLHSIIDGRRHLSSWHVLECVSCICVRIQFVEYDVTKAAGVSIYLLKSMALSVAVVDLILCQSISLL